MKERAKRGLSDLEGCVGVVREKGVGGGLSSSRIRSSSRRTDG